MQRILISIVAGFVSATMAWGAGINYNGTTLQENTDFTRTECGTMKKKTMKEISGLAASRQTPGYLWAHGDENTGDNRKIIAIQPDGTLAMTVNLTTPNTDRDDWEDIATGIYDGKNYVFIGAIGDNDLAFKDQYYIYYFEEPAISSGTQNVTVNTIRFGYPDNTAHNTETLMYDNVEQMFYIADKVDGVCHLYKLPFSTTYGTGVQRLTEVCALGNGSKFKLANGGDITPDGHWMAIKNEEYILLWERQGAESLSATAQRNPVQVMAYQKEEQGESLAWLNDSLFYTTSDSKKDTPIYQYVRWGGTTPGTPSIDTIPETIDSMAKAINEVILSNHYYAYINEGETVIRGWYLAGTSVPVIDSCLLSAGATWAQTNDTVTITALNGTTAVYTLDIQPVTPVEFSAKEIVFDGTETWVKSAYGWDGTKKWKFSKTDSDYSREIAGKTHVELFLPACDTLYLTPFSGTERDVRFYINGVEFGSKTKFVKAGLTLNVLQSAPFMLTIASAQTSGDGGIAAIRMARKPNSETDIETTKSDVHCGKVLREGRLYIRLGEKIYDITGRPVF
ncbi:MAG: hypothetical protein IJV28_06100 [Paludibacteraceae bacterium]|nr:hypothetical protein [Paludibacteraceae bacterium]